MATVQVNPEILRWARETAGLTLEEAAHKLHVGAARGLSPNERLAALEAGAEAPTRALLLKMSKSYRRPLLAFYMESPPARGDRGVDFRRLPVEPSPAQEGLVETLLRDVKARQAIVRAALEDEEEAELLPFVGSMGMDVSVDALCNSIRHTLGFDLSAFRNKRTISYLRSLVESSGVFVLLIGDLGSYHSALSVDHFRGCALADPIAPFIVINDQDAKGAWSFTLLHELAHIWLGQTGVSASIVEAGVERFCNDVAASLLLLDGDFGEFEMVPLAGFGDAVERINSFADAKNISRSMVAYQLFRRGVIGDQLWKALQAEFRRLWVESRAREREAARNQEGGPTYYTVRRYHIGTALVDLVSRMTKSGALTSTKAGKVLGVKPGNVYELIGAGS